MKKIAIIAAVAAALSSVPAVAQETVAVRYGDVDVASPAGTQVLANRIEAGAKNVCGRPDLRDIKATVAFQECKEAAVQSSIQQLASKGIELAN